MKLKLGLEPFTSPQCPKQFESCKYGSGDSILPLSYKICLGCVVPFEFVDRKSTF
jgi:hypothetical protein